MKKQLQRGFTLIELVMVIVILGVLAAVAMPKFTNLKVDAEQASATGLAGAIGSAAAIQFSLNAYNSTTYPYSTASACGTTYMTTANMGTCAATLAVNVCTVQCGGATGPTAAVTLP